MQKQRICKGLRGVTYACLFVLFVVLVRDATLQQ